VGLTYRKSQIEARNLSKQNRRNGMKFKGRWDDHPYEPHSLTERVSIVVATVVAILRVLFGAATRAKNEPAI